MEQITFNNNGNTITATIENGAISFENGKEYTLSKRYNESGICGLYIAEGGKTFSLQKSDFIENREALVAIAEAQPKKEKTANAKPRKKATTDFNTFRIASASPERIAAALIDALNTTSENLKNAGAETSAILQAWDLTAGAMLDETENARILKAANDEIAALMEEEKRKADEARKAQAQTKIAQLKALGLTAEELAELLK